MQTYMSNGHDFPGGSDAQDEKPEVEHKMVEVLGQMATAIQALGEGAQALKAKPLPAELRASMKTKDQELDATIFGANETYLERIQEAQPYRPAADQHALSAAGQSSDQL